MDSNARFAIRLSAEGTVSFYFELEHLLKSIFDILLVYLDVVSLFPSTFNNRPNGLRKDLANSLVALNPKFVRFPGNICLFVLAY